MKAIKVSELKAHLSQYLRRVRKGERIVVMDRSEPIAELIPLKAGPKTVFERLAREGRVKLGTQDRSKLVFLKMRKLPVAEALAATQAEVL